MLNKGSWPRSAQPIVGSFGMVTVAPFTALAGGLIYRRRRTAEQAAAPTVFDAESSARFSAPQTLL
jgi:hypothetical protein